MVNERPLIVLVAFACARCSFQLLLVNVSNTALQYLGVFPPSLLLGYLQGLNAESFSLRLLAHAREVLLLPEYTNGP